MTEPESVRPGASVPDGADSAEGWRRLAATLDHLGDPVLVTTGDGEVVLMNREAERLFGVPRRGGAGTGEPGVRENMATFARLMDDFRSDGEERRVHETVLRGTGTESDFPAEVVSRKILGDEGESEAVVSVVHDRTPVVENERRARELLEEKTELEDRIRLVTKELEERNRRLAWQSRELENAARLKNEFLASMSHELRTPINAVIGYTSLLREEIYGELTDRQKEGLARVNTASQHLLELINDILDVSKIDAGRMPVVPEEVSLRDVITELVECVEPLARDKDLDVDTEIESGLPSLVTDRNKLDQILLNILTNAIKFTSEGGVVVKARQAADDRVLVSVTDTGIGIEPGDLDRIFDDFRQVDQSPTREHGGTGLGLSITRKLVDLLDGAISVDSTYGQGTTFEIVLPVRLAAGRPTRQQEEASQPGEEPSAAPDAAPD